MAGAAMRPCPAYCGERRRSPSSGLLQTCLGHPIGTLGQLDADELGEVRDYESRGKNRRTVLASYDAKHRTRAGGQGDMRATTTTTAADFRLQESADQPLQSTLPTMFDAISHHDRHHGPSQTD